MRRWVQAVLVKNKIRSRFERRTSHKTTAEPIAKTPALTQPRTGTPV